MLCTASRKTCIRSQGKSKSYLLIFSDDSSANHRYPFRAAANVVIENSAAISVSSMDDDDFDAEDDDLAPVASSSTADVF